MSRRRGERPLGIDHLFAYGTLMRGYPRHHVLALGATYLGEGRARGLLLDLGPYPAVVDGDGVVKGEVYTVDTAELLATVDREEGYNFERGAVTVTLAGGRRVRAWMYRYRGSRERARPIADGDYRQARPPRRER